MTLRKLPESFDMKLTPTLKCALLLLSACDFEPVKGRLWYLKEMFLLSRNFEDVDALSCETALEQLEQAELVEEDISIRLTPRGREIAASIEGVSKEEKELISEFKLLLNDMSEEELLCFIDCSCLEVGEISIKFGKFERKQIALSLFLKEKISIGKAAEIAGVSIEELIGELRGRGISFYT